MSNPRRNNPNNGNQQPDANKIPINEEVLSKILDVEKSKIEMRISERALREKHIDNQAAIAKQQLTLQADLLKNKPKQDRLSLITIGVVCVVILIIVLSFLLALIYWKETEFAKYLLVTVSHIIVGVLAYLAGNKNKKSTTTQTIQDDGIEDAQIVN